MMFVVIRSPAPSPDIEEAAPDTAAAPDAAAAPRQAAEPGPAADPAEDPTLAPWRRRLLAFVIDGLVLTLVTGALWGRLLASFANRMSSATAAPAVHAARGAHDAVWRVFSVTTGPYLVVLVPTIILAITYYWLLTGYWGTTIGKRSAGLWVVSAADRSRIGLRASFRRALVFVLGGEVVPLFFAVDNLSLLRDRRRQALHDKAARTLVVRHPPQAS